MIDICKQKKYGVKEETEIFALACTYPTEG